MEGLPHPRGGVSRGCRQGVRRHESSPPAWGCFFLDFRRLYISQVFPTRVGVFLLESVETEFSGGLPHPRGGVSRQRPNVAVLSQSSPPAWGCFFSALRLPYRFRVFPTRVGVFLKSQKKTIEFGSLPHPRGGVSIGSPHAV